MKTILKLTSTLLLVSTLLSTNLLAYDEEPRERPTTELSPEQLEAQESRELQHQERMEVKIAVHQERIRNRMEARGINDDEIDAHLERLFGSL